MQKSNVFKIHPLLHYDLCLLKLIVTDSYQIRRLKSSTKCIENVLENFKGTSLENSKMATKTNSRLSCQPKKM